MKHIGQNVFELPTSFRNDIFGLCDHFRLTCDDVRFYSENLKDPLFQVRNERDDANGPRMRLTKVRTSGFQPLLSGITTDATALAGQDDDVCGTFEFMSSDSAANTQIYAQLQGAIHDATSTQESGKLSLGVASHDGDIANGLVLTGGSINDEVDVTIGNGSASLTTIAGDLAVTTGLNAGSSLTFDGVSFSRVITSSETFADNDVSLMTSAALEDRYSPIAGSSSIVTTGTVSSGTWQGTAIASAYLDSDTSHLSVAQTFTAAKTFGTTNKLQFRDANAYINSPDSNDIEIAATDITLDAAGTIKLEGPVRPTGQIQALYTSFSANDLSAKHYVSFNDGDSENHDYTHVDMPLVCPVAGKLLSVSIRQTRDESDQTYTLRLETQAAGVAHATGPLFANGFVPSDNNVSP